MNGDAFNKRKLLEKLHRKYSQAVYEKAYRMLGNRADAQDAAQEAFVRAYQLMGRDDTHRPETQLAWLYRITTYICLHALRARYTRSNKLQLVKAETDLVSSGNHDRDLYFREALRFVVLNLDERSQMILSLHYLDGMTQGEIAAALGLSRRAVVKRLTKLKKKVSHLFEQEGADD